MLKQCTKCKEWRVTDLYTKDRQKKDGLRSSCKICNCIAKPKEILSIEYKRCTKCKKAQFKEEFRKDGSKKDGLYPSCITCHRKRVNKTDNIRLKPGEKYIDSCGYVCIAGVPGRQHRNIIEAVIKRKLSDDEVVYHKDGDKTNSDIKNLEIMSVSEHHKHHYDEIKEKLKSNFEREMVCQVCKMPYISKSGKSKYCSGKCQRITRKEYLKEYLKTYRR